MPKKKKSTAKKVKKIVKVIKPKKDKKEVGRPSTISPDTIAKLREVFLLDYTVEEACWYAGISKDAYYRRLKKDDKFRNDMAKAQQGLFMSAKTVIAQEIIVKKNPRIALDVLKHRQPDRYSTKLDLGDTTQNGLPAGTIIVLPGSKPHPRILPEDPNA